MNILFLVVGKTTDSNIQTLLDDYQSRLKHYLQFQMRVIPELKNAKNLSQEQQKAEEGRQILSQVQASDYVVLLDERGEEMRSIEFASYMQKLMSAGRNVVFVVGGPYGFSKEVYERANHKLSLSKMTFSHQMVRLFFVEQIYRAMTILRGEPYHHE